MNLILIHIGKCGGGTVREEMSKKGIKHQVIHTNKAKYNPNGRYIILLRNPVERFVSAFYWRKMKTVVEKDGSLAENRFYRRYKNINSLCQDLSKDPKLLQKLGIVQHITHDINFYLDKFIKQCPRGHILGVICTETINKDLKRFFNINNKRHKKDNSKMKHDLTDESKAILRKYLVKDYDIINKLNEMRLLSEEQYKLLIL